MRMAFEDAGITPDEVGYVNAHGTSTPAGDAAELRTLRLALGDEHARRTAVSSTKGATGHTLGAAGVVEAIFTTLALRHGILPPTLNLEVADGDCGVDVIGAEPRTAQVEFAASNSFGFGGHNATVVLRRWDD
jgi:3-oxoacyl-[acyl-carrier-protein] synthase II